MSCVVLTQYQRETYGHTNRRSDDSQHCCCKSSELLQKCARPSHVSNKRQKIMIRSVRYVPMLLVVSSHLCRCMRDVQSLAFCRLIHRALTDSFGTGGLDSSSPVALYSLPGATSAARGIYQAPRDTR